MTFAWLVLGQRLNAIQGVGALLVLGGIALVRLDEFRGPDLPSRPDLPSAALTDIEEPVVLVD